jgi:hypothetical protein
MEEEWKRNGRGMGEEWERNGRGMEAAYYAQTRSRNGGLAAE